MKPTKKQARHAVVCADCESDNIRRNAWAVWNEVTQEWELDDLHDEFYCQDCEGTETKEVPIYE